MSTSAKREVALSYAQSKCPLLFQYKTRGLGRGVPLSFLSCYPKEEEFLYPPMTCVSEPYACALHGPASQHCVGRFHSTGTLCLALDSHRYLAPESITTDETDGCTIVNVTPQMS
jgi:hypothetical protein